MLTPVTMHKSEKYHIRRMSNDSRELVMKNFGCRRKVYNLYVNDYFSRLEACGYENGDDIPVYKLPEVSGFKKEYPYLKEVDSLGLANAKIAFESAVKRFRETTIHLIPSGLSEGAVQARKRCLSAGLSAFFQVKGKGRLFLYDKPPVSK